MRFEEKERADGWRWREWYVNLALFIFGIAIVYTPCLKNLTGKADDFLSPLCYE